jgi:transposase
MELEKGVRGETMSPQANKPEEGNMVRKEIWEELRRRHEQEGVAVAKLARQFELDRKTVRRCLRQEQWLGYERPSRTDTLLAAHEEYLRTRAPKVEYSARILFQELVSQRGYRGSYETVKRFVAPLRAVRSQAERALVRYETPPGLQSQIDWGQGRIHFRTRPVTMHLFVLTLGFSRRSFYGAYANETLAQFLEAHERAFDHFGGHTREHLYDRPRTVCRPGESGKVVWNSTFKAFADYWGFEPRLCAPYRAQTKGKVESGVKYVKRNFLPGRDFVDQLDFDEQLSEWSATVADVRIHGTVHERPVDRFVRELPHLVPTSRQPSFRLEAKASRIVADDYLVSFETNRYSVPFTIIGQPVDVLPHGAELRIFHRSSLIAEHPLLEGRHQMHILPEHGPGAITRNARQRWSNPTAASRAESPIEVEVRDLDVYEALLGCDLQEVRS